MLTFLNWLDKRLSEPSTYAALALALQQTSVNVPDGAWSVITQWGMFIAIGLGVVLSEVGSKSASQIALDVLGTLAKSIRK